MVAIKASFLVFLHRFDSGLLKPGGILKLVQGEGKNVCEYAWHLVSRGSVETAGDSIRASCFLFRGFTLWKADLMSAMVTLCTGATKAARVDDVLPLTLCKNEPLGEHALLPAILPNITLACSSMSALQPVTLNLAWSGVTSWHPCWLWEGRTLISCIGWK